MSRPFEPGSAWSDSAAADAARRGNRRRLLVFGGVFVLLMVIAQSWNFARPADFRSTLRLQITLPDAGGADAAAASTYASRLQLLNSRPVLARLIDQLQRSGVTMPGQGDEAVSALKAMLEVQPVAGSEVIQVQATGREPQKLADVLNALPVVVRAELEGRQKNEADDRLTRARQELSRLDTKAQDRRERLDRFRQKAGVVAERDDNEAVATHKGLSTAVNNATEKEAIATARLRALTDAAAESRMSTAGRQDPTLSSLEGKAHQVREDIREMERSFTPAFMEMDPKARALRVRLAELERQIVQQRNLGQTAALQAAREDVAAAQAQVARLKEKQAALRPALGKVSARLSDAKILEDDLAQIEKARRDLLERVARLESNEQRRVAQVTVLEPAVAPASPFRPDRLGDGAWATVAALVLAALAMALVEVFNRAPAAATAGPSTTTLVLSPAWQGERALPGPGAGAARLAFDARPAGPDHPALAEPLHILQQPEAAALLAATRSTSRLACAAGLLGLTAAEAMALTWSDLDPDAGTLQVRGAWARTVQLPAWLIGGLQDGPPEGAMSQPLLCDAAMQALDASDLQAMLASAALDAGLPQGASLTWAALRATCIDWLLGQGLKFSELPALVGRVDAGMLAALADRPGAVPRRSVAEIDPLMPALRIAPTG